MNLGVIGAGYVGITTAVCLASIGHKITVHDVDNDKLEQIRQKKVPFYENGLQELLEKVVADESLTVSKSVNEIIQKTEGCFICVGTPSKQDQSIDLSQVLKAVKTVGEGIKNSHISNYVIIIRSTIVPTTTNSVVVPILKQTLGDMDYGLCIVPEFLREGQAVLDFMNPDKIVIGSINEKSKNFAEKVFENFKENAEIIFTNPQTAEMIKYVNNSFFSTLISFSNEVANISEKIKGVDAFEVMNALIADKRITTKTKNQKIVPDVVSYLLPGCGFGGSCFPKDVNAIANFASSLGTETPLLDAVLKINQERPIKIVSLAELILENLNGKKISILGLAFKPETDDMRSSPSLEVINLLQEKGANLSAYDPKIKHEILGSLGISGITLSKNIDECLKDAELAILLTKWAEFRDITGEYLKKHMAKPLIIDGRGFLDKKQFEEKTYYKVGLVESTRHTYSNKKT